MKQFDMRRFGLVLKLDFAEGIRPLLWNALLMVFVYLFLFWMAHNVEMRGDDVSYVKVVCEVISNVACVAMYVYFIASVCRIFRDVQQKQKLTTYLMLPATNLEKFLSRWIYMLVFSIVGGIFAFFVADVLHVVWLCLKGYPVFWSSSFFMSKFSINYNPDSGYLWSWSQMLVYSIFLFVYAFFLLGGVFFRRYHFVATSAVGLLLWVGSFSLLSTIESYYFAMFYDGSSIDDLAFYTKVFAFVEVVFVIGGIALLTWLSYWLFCRYQVITRKLVNL